MTAWRPFPSLGLAEPQAPIPPRMLRRTLHQIATAHLWLTRFPVAGLLPGDLPRLAQTAWSFPIVGLSVGLTAAAVLAACAYLGAPAPVAALLAIGAMLLATGGLHEDGLADFADGGGAGGDRARRLEIMRDSRIGSYGVLALIVTLGLRAAAIAAVFAASPALAICGVLAVAAASRAGVALALARMAPARPDGLGRQAGRVAPRGAALALALAGLLLLAPALISAQPLLLWPALAGAIGLAQLWLARRAQRLLGGQTGDVLGALQQVGESAGLVALSLFAGG